MERWETRRLNFCGAVAITVHLCMPFFDPVTQDRIFAVFLWRLLYFLAQTKLETCVHRSAPLPVRRGKIYSMTITVYIMTVENTRRMYDSNQ
jgi:hypothetical protein